MDPWTWVSITLVLADILALIVIPPLYNRHKKKDN